jgi:hypothetical protein
MNMEFALLLTKARINIIYIYTSHELLLAWCDEGEWKGGIHVHGSNVLQTGRGRVGREPRDYFQREPPEKLLLSLRLSRIRIFLWIARELWIYKLKHRRLHKYA